MVLLHDLIDYDFKEDINEEKLLSLSGIKSIVIDYTRNQISNKSDLFCYARESIYYMLEKASNKLPSKYQLLVKEAFRPLSVQRSSYNWVLNKYKEDYTQLTETEICKLVSQYVAPVELAGHPTGGAIDVTLVENGKELFLGTVYNDEPEASDNKTYMNSNKITKEDKELRDILTEAMESVGFINYTPEWWHWSYGDKYWAYITKRPVKYNKIEDEEIRNLTTAST